MSKFYAFYLPQYHPIPENDEWYGKGFTEWRNVAAAKPLFPGHYQPHIPADLGFYDLRLRETVVEQIKLAKEYGVDGFLYWHYWFGNGKQLLEKPFQRVVKDKNLDLPFALAWANASWERKLWDNKGKNDILMPQLYPGSSDYKDHFYTMLPAFKDERYIRVDGKVLFIIYQPMDNEKAISEFIKMWRGLAKKEGLNDFYFVGHDFECRCRSKLMQMGFDAVYDDNVFNIHHRYNMARKGLLKVSRDILHIPTTFKYKDAIKYMITSDDYKEDVIPLIAPNWDHSPRSGKKNIIFTDCEPKYFYKLVEMALKAVQNKPKEKQIIIIKSWNEWGEGNYLEPDLKYGRGYLEAIRKAKAEE